MKRLEMKYYGDTILRKVAEPVTVFDDKLRALAEGMIETMLLERGRGARRPAGRREHTAHRRPPHGGLGRLPRARRGSGEPEGRLQLEGDLVVRGGCLCIPGVSGQVIRPKEVEVEYQDLDGKPRRVRSDRFFSRIVQHEIDHLNGVLFIDYLSSAQKSLIKPKLKEISESKHLF